MQRRRESALQDSSNPLVKSDVAFQLYLSALMKNGYEASINSAVRRRESILAAASKAATEASESTEAATVTAAASAEHSTALASTSDGSSQAASSQTVSQASSAPSSSSSQRIAQAVLSGKASQPFLSPDMARLSAALSTGSGVPGNPLVVTISERK